MAILEHGMNIDVSTSLLASKGHNAPGDGILKFRGRQRRAANQGVIKLTSYVARTDAIG